MRSVNAGYETAIAASCVKVAEIYDITLASGTVLYRTSHSEDIVWGAGGNTYLGLGNNISRGPVKYSITGEVVTCSMEWSELNTEPFLSIHKQSLTGATVTIKRILWNVEYAVGWEIIVMAGNLNIEWDSRGISLEVKSQLGSMNVIVPKCIHQYPCNWSLFEDSCGLTRGDYAYSGIATGGSRTTLIDTTRGTVYKVTFDAGDIDNPVEIGDSLLGGIGAGTAKVLNIVYNAVTGTTGTLWYAVQAGVQFVNNEVLTGGGNNVTVNGTPAEDTDFYALGELEMLTGNNAGQIRPILSNSVNTVTVFWPFVNVIIATDTYKIYPGCPKDAAVCDERFGNSRNWRGFAYGSSAADGIVGRARGRRSV